jgi:transposase
MKAVVEFPQILERGCGIDVHKDTVVATVRGKGLVEETRTYSTFTEDLLDLKAWLESLSISHIAMESTGIYWKPIYHILEDKFSIMLVNARHIKYVPGHKTDKKDSAWIAKLLLGGLLKGSFIPPAINRDIRDLYRYKKKLIGQTVAEQNRLHKVLEDANIKLSSVMSDLFGKSGTLMIKAIIQGETNAYRLADLACGSLKKKRAELIKALQGNIRDHHRYMLALHMEALDNLYRLIAEIEDRIDTLLEGFRADIALLETIPGVKKETATAIIAEMGNDMSQFPTAKHLASWAGLSPGNNESAGKKKSERITHGNKTLKTALTEAAWAAAHTKDSYLKRKYHSLALRRGNKKALIAIAHKMITAAYYILKNKEAYKEPDAEQEVQKRKQAQIRNYLRRLHELGYKSHLN